MINVDSLKRHYLQLFVEEPEIMIVTEHKVPSKYCQEWNEHFRRHGYEATWASTHKDKANAGSGGVMVAVKRPYRYHLLQDTDTQLLRSSGRALVGRVTDGEGKCVMLLVAVYAYSDPGRCRQETEALWSSVEKAMLPWTPGMVMVAGDLQGELASVPRLTEFVHKFQLRDVHEQWEGPCRKANLPSGDDLRLCT